MRARIPARWLAGALIAATWTHADRESDRLAEQKKQIATLKQELSALESLKADKLDELEAVEAKRWDARYKQTAKAKEHEERARALEESYSRMSGEVGKLEDELIKARNEVKEKQESLLATEEGWNVIATTAKRIADDGASAMSTDIPLGLEQRTQQLSQASAALERKDASLTEGIGYWAAATLSRLDLTLNPSLETRQTLFGDGRAATAWRLNMGTIFAGELEKSGQGASQILLRTGQLQGKTFVWRSDLAKDFNLGLARGIQQAVASAGGESANGIPAAGIQVILPFDVLQFKSTGSGYVRGQEKTAWARFQEWFKAGGVTLYPLFAVGFLALFMILERSVVFSLRNTNVERFMKRVNALLDKGSVKEAEAFCAKSSTSIGRVMHGILRHAGESRAEAEKSMREVLLKEIPALEKRLPFLAALGSAAPLLGLLGTVSGLVTLFKVLNQLGSNDPKVLAGGISEALVNTETGLAIAIPVLLIHGWLNEKLDTMSASMNSRGLELMNRLWPKS
jgi:biopolymer transport protein ExbB/TolQ